MEVEIISREFIKPSSQTPHHLRTHKLSLFDQISPSMYVPMVLFYPIGNYHQHDCHRDYHDLAVVIEETRSQLLKKSLSQTLSRFYPLAGRINDDLSIDCNDEGAYYVEARVKCHLSEFLGKPDFSLINQLLPSERSWVESATGGCVAMIQVSTFDCGGIVVGSFVSHMIMDGTSLSTFLNDWASTANKGTFDDHDSAVISCLKPDFSCAPSLYPQNDSLPKEITMMGMWYPFFKKGKAVIRRFVFDASALAKMKVLASTSVQTPTRVEAVTALICKCAMAAFKATSDDIQNPFLLTHAVNMRKKAVPPFTNYLMGNLLLSVVAEFTEAKTELSHLVRKLKEAIKKANGDLLKTLDGDQGFYKFCEALKEMGGRATSTAAAHSGKGVDFIGFSSWCNFGLYEVDFGWGKPMWVTSTGAGQEEGSALLNFVMLTETRLGDGIEACVTLDEQDMAILECDKEFLAFASLDPSPLQIGNLLNRT